MATAVITQTREPLTDEQLAEQVAATLIYKTLIEQGEPLKASEIARIIGRADVDLRLVRVIVATNPHMTAVDRKWTLWTRYLDARNTVDSTLQRILNTFGQPMKLSHLAHELHEVYGRPTEIYEEMLEHLVATSQRYFRIGSEFVAPTSWQLDIEDEREEEILFENFLEDDDVFPYIDLAEKVDLHHDRPESIAALLDAAGRPLKSGALQFLAWRRDRTSFDAAAFFEALFLNSGAEGLINSTWIGPKTAAEVISHFEAIAEREVSENAETEAQESALPLVISDEDREQLIDAVLGSDLSVHAANLLEDVFDISTDSRNYEDDLQTVIRTLAEDERVLWVGSDRFRPEGSVPGYVFTVPGLLEIGEYAVLDPEGNLIDQLLEDDGFDGGLEREILNPLAQDVLDEEPIPHADPNPPSTARAVIKYHHKQIGTMPLCQFPSGFFAPEPSILETEFMLPGGQKATVWVNNETRLLYGLLDWFSSIPIDSGATFTLERTGPDSFSIGYNDESEPSMFISRNRINELMLLQERSETEDLATFDIMREIMEHYRKGIEFITLHTEVNIVRRTTRRMVASLLTEYHCFFQRGGSWVYDAKKLVTGFDKSKKKYLVK